MHGYDHLNTGYLYSFVDKMCRPCRQIIVTTQLFRSEQWRWLIVIAIFHTIAKTKSTIVLNLTENKKDTVISLHISREQYRRP